MINHARAAFIVAADPDDKGRRLFITSKTNLGRPREGLAYRIADTAIPDFDGGVIFAPHVKWEESTVRMSADQAVTAGARAVWFQLGVIDEEAFRRTTEAGVPMVMDTCPAIEWPNGAR